MSHLLEVKNLQTHFRTRAGLVRAVDGVSFQLERGELLGLVGESGCGKSATALSLLRLVAPPGKIVGGEILFDSVDLLKLSESKMRAIRGDDVAMIFQDPMTSLNPVYTVGEQIAEALRLHRKLSRKQARAAAIEAMREVSIPDPARRVDDYPHQLSGGMRQRVMIAMALACDPKLLIADEPTTALDVTIQAQILELLDGLRQTRELAVLLITHDLGVVAEVADRVDPIGTEQFVAADVHAPQQDNGVASVDLENEGGDEGHTEVDVARGERLIGVGQELNVLHVHEPLGPQQLLGDILWRDADSRDLDQSNPRGLGGWLGRGRPGCRRGRLPASADAGEAGWQGDPGRERR